MIKNFIDKAINYFCKNNNTSYKLKKLDKHNSRIYERITRITSYSSYSMCLGSKILKNVDQNRNTFWWDIIWVSLYRKFNIDVMPTIFRALKNLFPIIDYDLSYFGIYHKEKEESQILYLVKKNKKDYIKEEVLTEMSEFINACLCGTNIKYVFYGALDREKTYRKGLSQIKLYEKEKNALMKSSYWKLLYDNKKIEYICGKRNTVIKNYYAHGWLFKIPDKISKQEAEKIFSRIREKRLRELHLIEE